MNKIIGFSPDISGVTFLLKKESENPKYAFIPFPEMDNLSSIDLTWSHNQNEGSLFSKMDFFEIVDPIENDNEQEIFQIAKNLWWKYEQTGELIDWKQKLVDGGNFSSKDYGELTTRLVTIMRGLVADELKKKSMGNKESL